MSPGGSLLQSSLVPLGKCWVVMLVLFQLVVLLPGVYCRKHHLEIVNDARRFFPISTFGFYQGGYLSVNVTKLQALMPDKNESDLVLGTTRT